MASTYLQRTPSSAGGQRTFTWSYWIKKRGINPSSTFKLFDCGNSTNYFTIYFPDTHTITIKGRLANSTVLELVTSSIYQDPSSWYNIVVALDTTQVSSSDRCKLYVNGTQVTAFATETYPSQDSDFELQDASLPWYIGCKYDQSAGEFFDGVMAQVECTDGNAYPASTFGSTNATTGMWTPNTSPSVTYGTNGFKLDFADSADMGNDVSGQANDFPVGAGTLTQTKDCGSNNFSTWNDLTSESWGGKTTEFVYLMSNGETTFDTTGNATYQQIALSNLGMTSGKYYMEIKVATASRFIAGICNQRVWLSASVPYNTTDNSGLFYRYVPDIAYDTNNYSTGITGISDGDILGFALDVDNKNWYIHVNGTYMNSGDPTSGATGTGSISAATSKNMFNHGPVFFCICDFSSSGSGMKGEANFGNGYFGTTAVSSAGTAGSTPGVFEYDVPSGYQPLSTKGINA